MAESTQFTKHPNALKHPWNWLIRIHPRLQIPAQRRQSRLLAMILLSMIPAMIIVSLSIPILNGSPLSVREEGFWFTIWIAVGLVAAYWFNRAGHYKTASMLTVVASSAIIWLGGIPFDTPLRITRLYYLVVPILLANILLSIRATSALILVDIVVMLMIPAIFPHVSLGTIIIQPLTFNLIVTSIVLVIARQRNLLEADRKADLEYRVIDRTAQLQEVKNRVETILNSTADAIAVAHLDGKIQQVNPAFNTLFGFAGDGAFGQWMPALAAPEDMGQIKTALDELVSCGQPQRVGMTALRQDGALFNADVTLSLIGDDKQNIVCVIHDISDHKRIEASLRNALQTEKELNEIKTRFVSMASHEFRTPLTTILMSSSLLRRNSRINEAKRVEQLDKISTQVKLMTGLLDEILIIGKSEMVGFDFHPQPLDLCALCRDIVDDTRLISPIHQVELHITGSIQPIDGDDMLLRKIVNNLLSNAIKYSPDGGAITCRLHYQDAVVTLMICDSGIGIPEEDQPRLFESFHRAENVGDIPGTGLGLAVVREAVHAHGGTITFESHLSKGTTFSVCLPLRQPDSSPQAG